MAFKSNNSKSSSSNSILAGLEKLGQSRSAAPAAPAKEDRPENKIWANIGYTMQDSNGEDVFINLPYGLAIETMQPRELPRKKGTEFRAIRVAQNAFLEQLQLAGMKLEPGESVMLPMNITVELRRTGEEEELSVEDNRYVMHIGEVE